MQLIEDIENIDFKGIIVSVPKSSYKGDAHDFAFEVEDAYTSNGTHGYPHKGSHPSDSSFYSICYDMDYLPNGLFFNRTSGFTLKHQFDNEELEYYKFDNMIDFCKWYLQRNGYTCTRHETTATKETYIKKSVIEETFDKSFAEKINLIESTKRNRLLEVSEYLKRIKEIEELRQKLLKVDTINRTEVVDMLSEKERELEEWLDK